MTPAETLTADHVPAPRAAATEPRTERIRIEQHGFAGALWFAGWLFTIGLLHLPFWKALLALIVWPYYVGVAVSSLP